MAQRTKSQFKALYGSSGTIFPDNTTGEISEEDMRNFAEDIADSFSSEQLVSAAVEVTTETTKTLSGVSKTYLFTGTGAATWTLPAVSGNTQLIIKIKNKTAHNITVQRAGTDNIFTFTTTTSITVGQGESVTLVNDGTHWTTI